MLRKMVRERVTQSSRKTVTCETNLEESLRIRQIGKGSEAERT